MHTYKQLFKHFTEHWLSFNILINLKHKKKKNSKYRYQNIPHTHQDITDIYQKENRGKYQGSLKDTGRVGVVVIVNNLLTSQNHDGQTISRTWGDVEAESWWLKNDFSLLWSGVPLIYFVTIQKMISSRSSGSEQILYSSAALSIQSCCGHVTDYNPRLTSLMTARAGCVSEVRRLRTWRNNSSKLLNNFRPVKVGFHIFNNELCIYVIKTTVNISNSPKMFRFHDDLEHITDSFWRY